MWNPFRSLFRHPAAPDSHVFYTPGPVFTEPAMAAIYNTDLAKPPITLLGCGYPISRQIRSIQSPQLFALKVLTPAGIGIQQGQYALSQLTDDTGGWLEGDDTTGVIQ